MQVQTLSVAGRIAPAEPRNETSRRAWPAHALAGTATLGSSCDACRFRANCLGHAFRSASSGMQPLVGYRRHLEPGEVLYHAGAKCSLVHVVQSGFFKTVVLSEDGLAQIAGFQMPGDVLGMDGFAAGVHRSEAIALTQASVCVISRGRMLQASFENEALCRRLLAVMSDEIATDHATLLLLGSRSAEERVAAFIVELSDRLAARGYSSCEIGLWMSREEIGRYLGLELETVSRVMSSLLKRGLVEVHRRHLHIRDLAALREAVAGEEPQLRHTPQHAAAQVEADVALAD